jgi:hypothetical protein
MNELIAERVRLSNASILGATRPERFVTGDGTELDPLDLLV